MLCPGLARDRLQRGNDAGALSDFDQAVSLSGGAKGEYFVQRARAWARVAMRSNGREEAMDGVRVGRNIYAFDYISEPWLVFRALHRRLCWFRSLPSPFLFRQELLSVLRVRGRLRRDG